MKESALTQAPALTFNRDDRLHDRALDALFKKVPRPYPTHYVPSSERFVDFAVAGYGYGPAPLIQIERHLQSGALVEVRPRFRLQVELYWHHWRIHSRSLAALTEAVVNGARRALRQ